MSDIKDFVIENGVLVKYTGNDKDVIIPDSVTSIGRQAFSRCNFLNSVTFSKNVTSIGEGAFEFCENLLGITIPSNVINIEDFAFFGCYGLKELCLSNGIKHIGWSAFLDCKNITYIFIPKSVVNIEYRAFSGCYNLKSIIVDEDNNIYDSRENCNAIIETKINTLMCGCKSTIIPNDIVALSKCAFYGFESLITIDIPNCIIDIGESAFEFCKGLKKLKIPPSVNKIRAKAFANCDNLLFVEIENAECKISSTAFYKCDDLALYFKEALLTGIDKNYKRQALFGFAQRYDNDLAFENLKESYLKYAKSQRKKLYEDVVKQPKLLLFMCENGIIPLDDFDTVFEMVRDSIELSTLIMDYKNTNFNSVECAKQIEKGMSTNPLSVAEIKKIWKFEKTKSNEIIITGYKGSEIRVNVPDVIGKNKVTKIGNEVFSIYADRIQNRGVRKAIKSIDLPDGINEIGDCVFTGCEELEHISIPNGVGKIGESSFRGCESLVDVVIPRKVKSIKNGTFDGCKKLENISLPKGIKSIGAGAFVGCVNLTNIALPDSVKSIAEYTFNGCKNLTIHAPAGSFAEQYAKENNIPFVAE